MKSNTIFWGLVLVLLGALLLLDNLGLLPVNVWKVFWPLALMAFGAWVLWGAFTRRGKSQEHVEMPLDGAARGRVRIGHGAGHLRLSAGAAPGNLLEGEFGGGVEVEKRRQGDELVADLRMPTQVFTPFSWSPGFTLDWDLRLTWEVPIRLEVESGANESRLDLIDLKVSELVLKTGASRTEIVLPGRAGHTAVRVESGAVSVSVHVPQGVAARISSNVALGSINVDARRFPRTSFGYQSPEYDTAENKADLVIETSVGSIDIH